MTETVTSSFESKIEPDLNSGCWLWARGRTSDGYGVFQMENKSVLAHRAAWIIYRGGLSSRDLVCHRCDTPSCVNPSHLFVGTQADNMADMKSKGRASRKFGAKNGRAALSDDQAREIIDLDLIGFTKKSIAQSYGVALSTVYRIIRRESFPHVWPYETEAIK